MNKIMAKWVAASCFTAAFGLFLSVFMIILKNVFKLHIPDNTVRMIVIALTIIFGFIMFKRIVGV